MCRRIQINAVVMLLIIASASWAQERPSQRSGSATQRSSSGAQRQGFSRDRTPSRGANTAAMLALLRALDKNRDMSLSKEEIAGAQAALSKLDTNRDGDVTRDELLSGLATPPNRTRSGSTAPARVRNRSPRPRRRVITDFATRLFVNDSNLDGKLSLKDELPKSFSKLFGSSDTDGDGFLDREEVDNFVKQRQQRGGGGQGSDSEDNQR